MNKELAKTLTLALIDYLDDNRPEGTMDCSSGECVSLEKAFTEENFDRVETLINKKLSRLTEFESSLRQIIEVTLSDEVPNGSGGTMSWAVALSDDDIKKLAPKVLAIAKKELLKDDELAKKHLEDYTKGYKEGYNKGYEVATKLYEESVAYHFPNPPAINIPTWTPPCYNGGPCTNPHHDCINCPLQYSSGGTITTPNTASGTSTATLHGNTSATDGKEHNPSFTD